MPKVEGLENIVKALQREVVKKGLGGSVVVGFTAAYALARHELPKGAKVVITSDAMRRAMFASIHEREDRGVVSWDQGEPKFLEGPARELSNSGELGRIVGEAVSKGKTLIAGVLLAGLRLQRESQKRVPIDTSNLKNSAFTRIE